MEGANCLRHWLSSDCRPKRRREEQEGAWGEGRRKEGGSGEKRVEDVKQDINICGCMVKLACYMVLPAHDLTCDDMI